MYTVTDTRATSFRHHAIVAPAGYHRKATGGYERDGSKSPEMGEAKHAYQFRTHRAAAIQAGKLANPKIHGPTCHSCGRLLFPATQGMSPNICFSCDVEQMEANER